MVCMLSLLNMFNGTISLQLGTYKNGIIQFILYNLDSGGSNLFRKHHLNYLGFDNSTLGP